MSNPMGADSSKDEGRFSFHSVVGGVNLHVEASIYICMSILNKEKRLCVHILKANLRSNLHARS